MPIEKRGNQSDGGPRTVMTACPYCGESMDENRGIGHHLPCEETPATEDVIDE